MQFNNDISCFDQISFLSFINSAIIIMSPRTYRHRCRPCRLLYCAMKFAAFVRLGARCKMAADSLLGDSFTRVTLTPRITECIEQVLARDSTSISKSFEKELKEAKELCNEEDPDKRVVSFHFVRSLHKAHRKLVSAAAGGR